MWALCRCTIVALLLSTNRAPFSLPSCLLSYLPIYFYKYIRSDILDRFAVMNVQLQHLFDQLRPLLRHYAARPRAVNQTNAPLLPIMLASKLLPEQEAEAASLAAEGGGMAEEVALREAATHNRLVDLLTQQGGGGGGVLDPRGQKRKAMQLESARAAAAVTAAAARQQQQATVRPGQQAAGRGPALEGPALLLAAAGYGAGLT
jgi:hypothetical protein